MKRLATTCLLLLAAVLCADANWQSRDSNYNVSISTGPHVVSCSYTPITTATQNVAYTGATPSASNGTPAYTFSNTGSLPPSYSISSSTGVISGTDTTYAAYTGIQVIVTDSLSNTANCGSSFTITVSPAFVGMYDVAAASSATWSVWYGLRAFSTALANAGASTTPVMDVRGVVTTTSCTIYLLGDGTGKLDFSTAGAGGVGNQCLLGATTFCTVTNTSCTVSKLYDQTVGLACTSATCNVVQATTANQPTLVMPGNCSFPNSASLPCLRSTTSTMILNSVANFAPNAAAQMTFSAVGNRTVGTGNAYGIKHQCGNGVFTGNAGHWKLLVAGSTTASTPAADAAWHAANGVMQVGTNADILNVDGTEDTASGTPSVSSNIISLALGAASTTFLESEGGFLDNYIASQAVRTNLCANQAAYYGTTAGTYC